MRQTMACFLFSSLLVSTILRTTTATYTLTRTYSGDTFFQGWDFFTDPDPTNGHVLYQSQANAAAKGLISIQGSHANATMKQAFIGVDSVNQAPDGRASVRIATQETFQHALVLADIVHQPGGICGVWPAFWMVGANWPDKGEIDIVEGVSTQPTNQMTLHTNAGPILDHKADFSGKLLTANCDVKAPNQPNNAGCGIADESNITFGNDFNAIGGGIYATQWTSNFIKIWFFPRNRIPADIQNGLPAPSAAWGTPNSLFQGSFSVDQHFQNLQIVLNTAFCGDWAGAVWSQTPECAALAPTCDEYVTNNPQAFGQAFWLINSIKVFEDDGRSAASTTSKSVSITTPSPTASAVTIPVVTVTETETIYITATSVPSALADVPTNINSTQTQPTGIGQVQPPGAVFGSPGFNNGKHRHKKRYGGAVLPSEA